MDVKIYPRSGLASKYGITLINSVGIIDNHYTGEVMGMFINKQYIPYTINPGDRVAQLIVEKRLSVDLIKVSKVDETARGEGGFGSTGIQ
jgi:dUTP pyrophosphatase